MANSFSKEEKVAFDEILEGFEDALVLSKNVNIYRTDSQSMERSGDIISRPMPYIMVAEDGIDQTANFKNKTQLSVPATIGYEKSTPWILDALELRDMVQKDRMVKASKQALASAINSSVMSIAATQGTQIVKVTAAASGFDDVALCEAMFNEIGVTHNDRMLALSTRDYNSMASNLASGNVMQQKAITAYEKAYVGEVASFSTFKLDYANRIAAAAGGGALTIDTRASANNYYTPVATRVGVAGERSNVDNRYQTITISSTTNVAAGDCFTIAGVNSVHLIEKGDSGQLKTFRVISVDSATTMTISPPIISNQGATDAEEQYQNCTVTPSAIAAIVFLNTVAAAINPFWQKEAIELLPGLYANDPDSGTAIMSATTDQGIQVVMEKFRDINTKQTKYRLDTRYGVAMLQPEMCGIMIFNQT